MVRSASEVIDATGLGGGSFSPGAPLPEGFSEVELLISGEATSYKPVRELTADGNGLLKKITWQIIKSEFWFGFHLLNHLAVLSLLNG